MAVAGLHILLSLVGLAVAYLTLWCRIQDGVASEKELARIALDCDEEEHDCTVEEDDDQVGLTKSRHFT